MSILKGFLSIVCCISASIAMSAPPDAGETSRELRPRNSIATPQLAPPSASETRTRQPDDDVRFRVNLIRIEGNRELGVEELHTLVTDLEGADHNLVELRNGAARITQHYRRRGYAVARAYLPAQEIKDGIVTIAIVEGRIDKRSVANHSRLSDERAEGYFKDVREGDVIRSSELDRSLLLLSDVPGVGDSRATLQPGASVGTSDLLVALGEGAAISGNVSADNFGNRYTGEYRAGGTLNFNSPLHWGDQLQLTTLTTGNDLVYGRAAYQLPIANDGLQIGIAYFGVRYRLGKEFAALDAHGNARGGSVFAGYPIIRSAIMNLIATMDLEQKYLTDEIDSTDTVTDKRVRLGSAGLSWNFRDAIAGGGANNLDFAIAHGHLEISSLDAREIDAASARTAGGYTKLSYGMRRLQRVGENWMLAVSFSGQEANKNLDTSEKFAVGGVSGVRAYPQGEGVGDEGHVWSIEARYRFSVAFQGIAFYDAGASTLNHDPFGPRATNRRELSGAGIGANLNMFGVQMIGLLAWPIEGGDPVSMPSHAFHSPLAWIQVSTWY